MVIELKNVNKTFDNSLILKGINLKIKKGEIFLIKGESGKGKTTLLNIIGMIEEPTSGSLIIEGVLNPKIDKKSGRELLQHKVSYLFQNYSLIDSETIKNNLMIPLEFKKINKKEKLKRINKVLEVLDINKNINTKVYTLSRAEQQKIAVAKILLKGSGIILCDEPTGSLDNKNRNEIIKLLLSLKKQGKTIIIVSHDTVMEKFADNVHEL